MMAPVSVFAPLILRKAPPLATPVPLSVIPSAIAVKPPWTSNAAPAVTEVVPAVVPSAVLFWMFTTPALMVVAPV